MKHYNKMGKALGKKPTKKRMGGGNTMMAKKNGKKMMSMRPLYYAIWVSIALGLLCIYSIGNS